MKLPILLFFACFCSGSSEFVQKESIGGRIVGGEAARVGQFPFAAAIHTTTPNGNYFCGGTLLSAQWILTAGQCVDGVQLFNILLGTNSLSGNDPYALRVSSDTYVLHPDYDPKTLDNDIGVIYMRIPVKFNDYLKPVDFLPSGTMSDGSKAIAIGWGQIGDDESGLADQLQFVSVTSLTEQECKLYYGSQVTQNMVCVGGSYNEGTCLGDSGSPLVQYIKEGVFSVVVGVSSFYSGNGCESTDPSGFTKLYQYNSWIMSITDM